MIVRIVESDGNLGPVRSMGWSFTIPRGVVSPRFTGCADLSAPVEAWVGP
jgi:hypothetical protein